MSLKVQATKDQRDKLNFITIKTSHASKGIVSKMQRKFTEWEKIFANLIYVC